MRGGGYQQASQNHSEVKAIVSSAEYYHPAMRNYKGFGFKDILSKPYSLDELKTKLHKLLHENS